jgi:hypothetical protein
MINNRSFACVLSLCAVSLGSSIGRGADQLGDSLTFYASFDKGLKADFSKGDPELYTILKQNPSVEAKPGNLTDGKTRLVAGAGLSGDALRFTARDSRWLFYKTEKNLPFSSRDWSGSVSLWLKVDPKKELAPGYCDPIQITPRKWNDASFFVDFNKDGDPRDFRLGAFADLSVWNPENKDVNSIPDKERPLVVVQNPPFSGDKWTHVVFTWKNYNTGKKDGVTSFYMNGKLQGKLTGRQQSFGWRKDEVSRILIGLAYIGLFDELSCFDRELSAGEVKRLYGIKSIDGLR